MSDSNQICFFLQGESEYAVLLPENATASERFAAEELNLILEKTTGKALPVVTENGKRRNKVVSVGATKLCAEAGISVDESSLGNGGYILQTVGENIFIHAATESGKLNGVYAFAEKVLGYTYFCFDEIRYEQHDTVCFGPLHESVKPAFDGRNVHSPYTLYQPLHAARLKCSNVMNSWDEKFGQASTWATLHDMSNVFQLLPVKKYYKDHPDWFYLAEEYRDKADTFAGMDDKEFRHIPQKNAQLCYTKGLYDDSEGGMFDTYVRNLIGYIQREPDAQLFMLGMGDNEYNCDCEQCRKETEKYKVSGVTLRFVNKVARRVNAWLKQESGTPDRKIFFVVFAYLTAMEPPVKWENGKPEPIDESVVAEENVCIRIAPLSNVTYYWEMMDPDHNSYMRKAILGWKRVAKHFTVWDYRVHYKYLAAQYPCWNTVKKNLLLYKELGVIDVFQQAYSEVATPFIKLDDYIRSVLLFDLSRDVRELSDRFIENYYKEAAPYIREYLTYLRRHYEMVAVPNGYSGAIYHSVIQKKYWPLSSLMEMKVIISKAYESISQLPEERKKILKERLDFDSRFYRYCLLELYPEYFTKQERQQMLAEWACVNEKEPLKEHSVRIPMSEKLKEWTERTV